MAEIDHKPPLLDAEPVLSLDCISVSFSTEANNSYLACTEVDLKVHPGEFIAIVGPTGCGKSTLLNVAAGLLAPASGSVTAFGQPLTTLNARAGYLFQADALMPWKTALQNVAVALESKGVKGKEANDHAAEWLEKVGLALFGGRYPHMMSGGQRKRVALAQTLIRDPELLLMDEPFGPLDAQTRQIMGNLLLRLLAGTKKAVMFVTHDLEEAISLADRILVMSAGPASRVIGDYKVSLPRPRDIVEIRAEQNFNRLHSDIWATLKFEVQKTYAEAE